MTIQELLTRTFQLSGEPTDLCPFLTPGDPTTYDSAFSLPTTLSLVAWVNQGMTRIANWEYGDGSALRFRHLRRRKLFKKRAALTGTVSNGTADTIEVVTGFSADAVDQFEGWTIEAVEPVTGTVQRRIVLSNTAGPCVCLVHADWDTVPDATYTFRLYGRTMRFNGNPVAGTIDDYGIDLSYDNELGDLLRVRDLTSLVDMSPAPRGELFTASYLTKALPTMFLIEGRSLVFDNAWDLSRSYELVYYGHPTPITADTAPVELDVPSPYHEAIALWTAHFLLQRSQDFNGAYALKRDLMDLMQTLRMNDSLSLTEELTGFHVYGG